MEKRNCEEETPTDYSRDYGPDAAILGGHRHIRRSTSVPWFCNYEHTKADGGQIFYAKTPHGPRGPRGRVVAQPDVRTVIADLPRRSGRRARRGGFSCSAKVCGNPPPHPKVQTI